MQILVNRTNDLGFDAPKELLIESSQIRTVEVFTTVNALSNSVSRITLRDPETYLSDEEDGELRLITEHQSFYVFETPSEIKNLCEGVTINIDYSKLTHKF